MNKNIESLQIINRAHEMQRNQQIGIHWWDAGEREKVPESRQRQEGESKRRAQFYNKKK